ncbi:hypothetical protein [Streptomyces sp. BRA346]
MQLFGFKAVHQDPEDGDTMPDQDDRTPPGSGDSDDGRQYFVRQ